MRRLLIGVTALSLVVGIGACGDDDDDDGAADTSEEAVDGGEPITDFCADFNDDDGGDTPVDEVETSLDTARAAQAETDDQSFADAIDLLVDYGQYLLDNDDGDGVITAAEQEDAAFSGEFDTLEDAIAVVTEGCAPASRAKIGRANG